MNVKDFKEFIEKLDADGYNLSDDFVIENGKLVNTPEWLVEDKNTEIKVSLLKCKDCGTTENNVRTTICPYAETILNETHVINLCDDCYNKRYDEI